MKCSLTFHHSQAKMRGKAGENEKNEPTYTTHTHTKHEPIRQFHVPVSEKNSSPSMNY